MKITQLVDPFYNLNLASFNISARPIFKLKKCGGLSLDYVGSLSTPSALNSDCWVGRFQIWNPGESSYGTDVISAARNYSPQAF